MRWLLLLAVAASLAACGSGSSAATSGDTRLTVTYWPEGPGAGGRKTWTLRCEPAGGTLARPGAACRRVRTGGAKLFAAVPRDLLCTEIYGGPQTALVVGTVRGTRVRATFNRTNGCEISRWNRLSPWLLPRGGVGI